MWISSYKLEKNILPPYWIKIYLRKYMLQLKANVCAKLGNQFKVTMEFSMHSEAEYLTIMHRYSHSQIKISFRNHDNFNNTPYDEELFLYKFNAWKECGEYFLENRLYRIKKSLKTTTNSL